MKVEYVNPLIEEDSPFKALAEKMPFGIMMLANNKILYSNNVAKELLVCVSENEQGELDLEIIQKELGISLEQIGEDSMTEANCSSTNKTLALRLVNLVSGSEDSDKAIVIEDITEQKTSQDEVVRMAHQVVCLRNVSQLLSKIDSPIEVTMNSFVHLILEGWRYPNHASSRVSFGSHSYESTNFIETEYRMSKSFTFGEEGEGVIEMFYDEDVPIEGEIFTEGEQILIDTLATELEQYIQRKQAEAIQEQQHQELEIYASLLRHDLKNDLGIILGNVEILGMIVDDTEKDVDEIVESLEAVCLRMNKLLTSFSRSKDDGKQNIITLIEEVADQAEKAHRGLSIEVNAEEKAELVDLGKSRLLPLVFENLFRNSATHASEDAQITVDISVIEQNVQITVSDDGPGISEEVRDRLFEKGASTRGGGLGLYLSRKVVGTLGGTIELVDPAPGRGATFQIEIPINI